MMNRQTLMSTSRAIRLKYNERIRRRIHEPFPRSVVPSFFTLMNLFCGFLAIIQIHNGQLIYGAWLIVIAGLFDIMDGFMARLSNGTSEFGIELDSLSDVVSFGVAPGFLLYSFSLSQFATIGIILSAFPALFGAVRLARFNVEAKNEGNEDYFRGLPIPAQAIMLVAFVLLFQNGITYFEELTNGKDTILIPMVIILSALMVTTIPFDKIPRFNKAIRRQDRITILFFLFYIALILLFQHYGLLIAFGVFILRGLIRGAYLFWLELLRE